MNAIIELENLEKKFGKHQALNQLNLTVNEGDFFGFIGPNGAGKSTTIRILLGLLKKDAGQAKLFGKPVKVNNLSVLKRIGYMPSEAVFYPNLTVKETLRLSSKLYGHRDFKEQHRLMELFELDASKRVKDLSLGNRKKISIISALQTQPELYILDEPTSGLDPLMQQAFWHEIKDRHQKGATIFVSSHVLNEVQRYCQKAAIIRSGQIIIQDSVSHLIQTPVKHVRIDGVFELMMEGIQNVTVDDHGISFDYSGNVDYLIDRLHLLGNQIKDINISQPDIETIFMHYYQLNQKEMQK